MNPINGNDILAALAIAAVLGLPGRTNRLLWRAGASRGLPRALPLVAAQWLAQCLAIGTWCTALGVAAGAVSWLPALAGLAVAAYLPWDTTRQWRAALPRDPVGSIAMFPAALADPAALFCAAVVFPPLGAAAPDVLRAYLLFTAIAVPLGAGWLAAGNFGGNIGGNIGGSIARNIARNIGGHISGLRHASRKVRHGPVLPSGPVACDAPATTPVPSP